MIEACFKGVGRALRQALRRESRELPSTKGVSVTEAVIIDSGGANLASLQFALERLGARAIVSSDARAIAASPRVLLPGVGSAADAMQRLRRSGLAELLPTLRQPVLGICLGMQLLFEHSAEGPTECLGVLPGQCDCSRRPRAGRCRTWVGINSTDSSREDPLLDGIEPGEYFYFVHSYAVPASEVTLAEVHYGRRGFRDGQARQLLGTQFHPERSASAGRGSSATSSS